MARKARIPSTGRPAVFDLDRGPVRHARQLADSRLVNTDGVCLLSLVKISDRTELHCLQRRRHGTAFSIPVLQRGGTDASLDSAQRISSRCEPDEECGSCKSGITTRVLDR